MVFHKVNGTILMRTAEKESMSSVILLIWTNTENKDCAHYMGLCREGQMCVISKDEINVFVCKVGQMCETGRDEQL